MLVRKEMDFRDFDDFSVDLVLPKGSTDTSRCCDCPRRKLKITPAWKKKKKSTRQTTLLRSRVVLNYKWNC